VISQKQKDLINRNNPGGYIYFNVCELFREVERIPMLKNGSVIVEKLDDKGNWKENDAYKYVNYVPQEMKKRNKKFINEYDENDNLISSGLYEYINTNGKISSSKNTTTDETFTFKYPSDNCVVAFHKSSKTDFQVERTQCRNDNGKIIQCDEYIIRDGGKETKTTNKYIYNDKVLVSAVYQEYEAEKKVRDVLQTYEYENGLLIKETTEAKVFKITNTKNYKYEVFQNDSLEITQYILQGSKPLKKLQSFKFDNKSRLIQYIYHGTDMYNRRYKFFE
jgi:hypothetical protein